jgi:spermidine/putrescine transport system permease protein
MILPLYRNIEKLDKNLLDAARDLGARRLTVLFEITLPLTIPGIVAGSILVFLPAMTLFYIPDILGGAKSILLGNLIENQFLSMNDWPGGSTTSTILTLLMFVLMYFYRKTNQDHQIRGRV